MTVMAVNDAKCWGCGTPNNLTRHHAIPQRLKPHSNITVPVCKKCHNRINILDIDVQKVLEDALQRIKSAGECGGTE